jgi:hypothetical protein
MIFFLDVVFMENWRPKGSHTLMIAWRKTRFQSNILDVVFLMNVLFFQWDQKNTPKSLGYDLALEVDEGYMSLHVDFSLPIV